MKIHVYKHFTLYYIIPFKGKKGQTTIIFQTSLNDKCMIQLLTVLSSVKCYLMLNVDLDPGIRCFNVLGFPSHFPPALTCTSILYQCVPTHCLSNFLNGSCSHFLRDPPIDLTVISAWIGALPTICAFPFWRLLGVV